MKKMLIALVVTAGALSIAGGGVGIALVDSTPTFGEREFISLEGGGLEQARERHDHDDVHEERRHRAARCLDRSRVRRVLHPRPHGEVEPAARRSARRSS